MNRKKPKRVARKKAKDYHNVTLVGPGTSGPATVWAALATAKPGDAVVCLAGEVVIVEPGVSLSNHDPSESRGAMTVVALGTGCHRA